MWISCPVETRSSPVIPPPPTIHIVLDRRTPKTTPTPKTHHAYLTRDKPGFGYAVG